MEQHLISDTAGSSVAVASPILLVQRNKGQHIYGSLKEIERVVPTCPMKAVAGIAALCIALVAALTTCAALVCMARSAAFVAAHEHGVVVVGGFIDHTLMHKAVQHIPIDPTTV